MKRYWSVTNCSLFESLTTDQLARLELRARVRRFEKGSVVYLPSDPADGVLLLADGRVKLCSITANGKEAILGFVEPGELFGELAVLGDTARDERAEALIASTAIFLPLDEIENLMAGSASLTLGVTKLIGWRRKRIERRLRTLLFRCNRERLIHLLLDLSEQYGQSTAEGLSFTIRLSHQELASLIGATRETVTVVLGELQLEGFLKVSRQRVTIRDLPKLAESVGMATPGTPGPTRNSSALAATPVAAVQKQI